jgi:putative sigma-54 modulation protein
MQITYTGHQLEVTDGLKNFAQEKLDNRLSKYASYIVSIEVVFSVEKINHIMEATVHLRGETIHAEAESKKDMYDAINHILDKLERQIQKHKEKENKHS